MHIGRRKLAFLFINQFTPVYIEKKSITIDEDITINFLTILSEKSL